jgi:DNA-binding CsgD family transcriptional regulator
MALSISGSLSVQPSIAHQLAQVSGAAPVPRHSSQQTPAYTVKLSQAAQVNQLSAQGQTPSEIASGLGISLANVNVDLGVVAAKIASAPIASIPIAISRGA